MAHTSARLVYYGHDQHFARMTASNEVTPGTFSEDEIRRMEAMETSAWQAADVVLYPSPDETALVRRRLPEKTALTIAPYYYEDCAWDAAENLAERAGVMFVAGFAHPPNVDAAVWLATEIMPLVWKRRPGVVLSLVGSHPTPDVVALKSPLVEVTGWVSDEELAARYLRTRVAAAPLRYGAGVKSKVTDAMRFGVPLVTTDVGVQGLPQAEEVVDVGTDAAVIAGRIVALLDDDDLWRKRSKAALAYIEARFGPEVMQAQLREAIGPFPAHADAAQRAAGSMA
jgi:glycosyltransferase involved in cell wall biosynthesis